jgi:membrane protein YdbS with pleckstrin-like domain
MEIKKSLYVLLRNLIVVVVLMILLITISNYLKHYTNIYVGSSTHTQMFITDLMTIAVPLFITFLAFLITTLRWKSESYSIKDNLIVYKHGVLNKQIRNYPIENIESISFDQSLLGKVFNYGSIYLIGSAKHKNILMVNIDNPHKFYLYIKKYISGNVINSFKDQSLDEIIKKSENDNIEFKSSFRWDFRQNKVNKDLEKTIMKTIAGFMNSSGGILVIGINDEGSILGIEADYRTLQKKTADGFANLFTQTFYTYIGLEYRYLVRIDFEKIENKDICTVHVNQSTVPIYLKDDKLSEFYVRTGNSTNMLNVREANTYIKLHWI